MDRREQERRQELCRAAREREAASDRESRRAVARHDVVVADREEEKHRDGKDARSTGSQCVVKFSVPGSQFSEKFRAFTENWELRTGNCPPWTSSIAAATS